MRPVFLIVFIATLILGGWFVYYTEGGICNVPISYRLGTLDERFNFDEEDAKSALKEAELIWEDAIGMDLFVYEDDADFSINFIFDERQALATAEETFRERLDVTEYFNESINERYERLVSEYDALRAEYDTKREVYERALFLYNEEVEEYNDAGGAPPSEFDRLEREKKELQNQNESLDLLSNKLNELAEEVNRVGREGNKLIESYNRDVQIYNTKFGDPHEFTQGDYQGSSINIYKFSDREELVLVLAHEFGHALSIDHVKDSEGIMHYLMGEQPIPLELSRDDIEAYDAVCGSGASFATKLFRVFGI